MRGATGIGTRNGAGVGGVTSTRSGGRGGVGGGGVSQRMASTVSGRVSTTGGPLAGNNSTTNTRLTWGTQYGFLGQSPYYANRV